MGELAPGLCAGLAGLTAGTFLRFAVEVDRAGRFPSESLGALRNAGLLGWFVPESLGGREGGLLDFCRACALIGEGCTSTALIWAMHCQQTAVLARHALPAHADSLRRIGAGALIASVTTEPGKGGDLLSAVAPLRYAGQLVLVDRSAPVVSYGEEADFFLITMRRDEQAPTNDVALVLLERGHASVEVRGAWEAMGMRGTRSVPMNFSARVPRANVLTGHFPTMALQTMIPVGHLGWASSWFGAARGAMQRLVDYARRPRSRLRVGLSSELFIARLAEQRMRLDLLESLIASTAENIAAHWRAGSAADVYESPELKIRINNVKLASAKLTFAVVTDLVEMAGLADGYLAGGETGIERVFRDLRSASLMFHDDRLLAANGRLTLIDRRATGPLSPDAALALAAEPS
jgi:acyl-CoA dehydrogenase